MRASHPGSQKGRRKAERCMFHCALWHWRTSTSSPLMVEVAPVTSITRTVECPTFSQAQQLLLLLFFFPHSLKGKGYCCLFKCKLFSNNRNIVVCCCVVFVILLKVQPVPKQTESQFKPINHPSSRYPLPKWIWSACGILCLCFLQMCVHGHAFTLCFKHNNISEQAGLLQS